MGPAPVVPGKQVGPLASNADPGASPNTPCRAGDTPPADHHDPLRCFQGVACCEFRCELPLQDLNLDYLIQSAGPRATKTDKLTGNGVPTSISALSV